MKVTLIYVGVGVAGFNQNFPGPRPKGDREGSWIGHGIASIGACVRASGFDVNLIDLRQLPSFEELGRQVAASPTDVYGLSISAVDEYAALKCIFEIKTHAPQAKIIVGGIAPTIFPEKFELNVVDTIVQGEGEITFIDLLRSVESGEPLPKRIRGEKPALSVLPWVARDLFDYQRELDCFFSPDQKTPSVTMLAGRGCPYHCNYCQPAENSVFGKPYRMRSPENVVDELHFLNEKYQFKSVTFWDDTFTFKKDWIARFCELYERGNFNATIAACSRADIIVENEDMVERLAQIGLDWFVVGLETGTQRMLDFIRKGTTVNDNRMAVEICRKHGIKVFGTFMLGLPTETRTESKATVDMIQELKPALASPFWFRPIPGTGIYDYCEKNDLILESVKNSTIERTGVFMPTIKGVDYEYIRELMPQMGVV
jgi:anaerobic magnesium-protoporphyrin IX monomethyl ester cyclase